MVVERHLEQWAQAEAAFRLQGLHQLLERQILMGLGLQRALLDLCEHLANGGMPVDIRLEYLGVDEKAKQAFGLDTVAIGDRHADTDVLLAAVAMQQDLIGRQQQHEQRDAFAPGQVLEAIDQRRRQRDIQTCAAMGRHGWTLVIKRQLQYWLLTAEQIAPVIELTSLFPSLHPVALPHRVVGILERQRRQVQRLTLAERGVELHQFVDHYLHRPAVRDDVMLHQHQHVFLWSQTQQADAHQRALA